MPIAKKLLKSTGTQLSPLPGIRTFMNRRSPNIHATTLWSHELFVKLPAIRFSL